MSSSLAHGKTLDPGAVGIDQDQLPPWQQGAIDLRAWFGPERAAFAVELEIGSGKGTFLVQQAAQKPQVNYVGVEFARQFWLYAADRCRRHGLNNVRLVHTEAVFFVRNYVPDAALRQVHIYFPDPWPKARHHKRRLVQQSFLELLHVKLEPAALVRIVTDHDGYFAWMQEHAAAVVHLYERLDFQSPASAGEGELVGTNFERKYRREGRPFHGMILRKR